VLLSSDSLSDAIEARDVRERVSRHDARLVDTLHRARTRLAAARRALIAERAEAAVAEREARAHLREVEDVLRRRRLVLDRARSSLDGLIARRERAAGAAPGTGGRGGGGPCAGRGRHPSPGTREHGHRAPVTPPAAPSTAAPTPTPAVAPVPGGPSPATLERIAQCESGGNPRAVSADGQYRGKYQFSYGTWAGVGGSGDPAAASEAERTGAGGSSPRAAARLPGRSADIADPTRVRSVAHPQNRLSERDAGLDGSALALHDLRVNGRPRPGVARTSWNPPPRLFLCGTCRYA